MKENYIEINNISYKYKESLVLRNISFNLKKGDILMIIGPNGSGKTTLLKNIIGLEKPTSGSVLIGNKLPRDVRENIAYVPQKFSFDSFVPVTVEEFMSLEKCGKKDHGFKNIKKSLSQVGIENLRKEYLSNLSGGQFQRVMIARAFLHEKDILVFDEPVTGLDIEGEKAIYDLILESNKKRKTTCIIVSHELNVVNKYATNVLCLNKKMICYGKPEASINSDNLYKLYGTSAGLYHSH
ncbi:metal ABC transporter ATP-binding protein [bacterium]|nr:metal ABC transporter ATP-binding protein [bacterium]